MLNPSSSSTGEGDLDLVSRAGASARPLFRPILVVALVLSGFVDISGVKAAVPDQQVGRDVVVTFADDGQGSTRLPGATPTSAAGSWSVRRDIRSLMREMRLATISEWPIRALGLHAVVFRVPDGRTIGDVLDDLVADSRVESAQALNAFRALISTYDDPYWQLQQDVQDLGIPDVHGFSSGRNVRVAIIDTGVDFDHPELRDRVFSWRSFVGDDPAEFRSDRHGTAVAGVIASNANNGEGIVGVAPGAKLQVLKACWHRDDSDAAVCNSFTLAQAIAHALDSGVQVINMSLTGPHDPLLGRLLEKAFRAGITIVAAADDGEDPGFPASLDTVIGVSTPARVPVAQLFNTRRAPVLAPGDDIITPVPDGGYDFLSGSSLAAAHVSGVIALLLERAPDLRPGDVDRLLRLPGSSSQALVRPHVILDACSSMSRVFPEISCRSTKLSPDF